MRHIKIVAGRRNSTNEGPRLGGFGVLGVLGFWGVLGGGVRDFWMRWIYIWISKSCAWVFGSFGGYWGFRGFLDGVDLRI